MDIAQAKNIICALSRGIDPASGELLANESCFNQPSVIRALYAAFQALEKSENVEKRKTALPENAGKPWAQEEDDQLTALFDAGSTIVQIATEHRRTQGSIKARLEKLGKISRF